MSKRRLLGVVLAGGSSSRFGSDKALARIGGASLLDSAVAALRTMCDEVVVAGRDGEGVSVSDWPRAGMGPLGGIAGGLRYAETFDFTDILTCGVDSIGLPSNLPALLAPAPAYAESQPVIGLWPVTAIDTIAAILESDGRHSMLAFASAIAARPVQLPGKPANINTPEDLAEVENQHGL